MPKFPKQSRSNTLHVYVGAHAGISIAIGNLVNSVISIAKFLSVSI